MYSIQKALRKASLSLFPLNTPLRGFLKRIFFSLYNIPRIVVASRKKIVLHLDFPAKEGETIENYTLSGWAFAKEGVKDIHISVNRAAKKEVCYGIERHDVLRRFYPLLDTAHVGFSYKIPLKFYEKTACQIEISCTSNNGKTEIIQRDFFLPPIPYIHSPVEQALTALPKEAERLWMQRVIDKLPLKTQFHFLIISDEQQAEEEQNSTLHSLQNLIGMQSCGGEICRNNDELLSLCKNKTDAYLIPLYQGDKLKPEALFELLLFLNEKQRDTEKTPKLIIGDTMYQNRIYPADTVLKEEIQTSSLYLKAMAIRLDTDTPAERLLLLLKEEKSFQERLFLFLTAWHKDENEASLSFLSYPLIINQNKLAERENQKKHPKTFKERSSILYDHFSPYIEKNEKQLQEINADEVRKILVLKLDHIGDVILGIPAIRLLKQKYPKATISVLCGKWATSFLEKVEEIDTLIRFNYFNERSEKWKNPVNQQERQNLQKRLQNEGFDMMIDLRRHAGNGEIFSWFNTPYKIAYQTDENRNLLTHPVTVPDKDKDMKGHAFKTHLTTQLCRLVSSLPNQKEGKESLSAETMFPNFSFNNKEELSKRFSPLFSSKRPMIGIHPGTGSSIRQWPLTSYAKLSDILIEKYHANIIFFGVAAENEQVESILSMMKHRSFAHSLVDQVPIPDFMAFSESLALFISNLTGPSHIAGMMGCPTLTIFGGQFTPSECNPPGDDTLCIRVGIECAPCYLATPDQCPYQLECLRAITAEELYHGVQRLLLISGKVRV